VPKQSEEFQTPSFSWRAPRSFLSPTGEHWDFQNPLDLDTLSNAIERHFDAWKRGVTDQGSRPLFMCLADAGTGNSRLLNEFPGVVQRQIFSDKGSEDKAEMKELLKNAFAFNVAFTYVTRSLIDFADPSHAIGLALDKRVG
uniref:Uncharacterized protein n=1 Tax=Globisporangium ultimum (strain ATCC 200006 / CBS 805.95 / DAOM BR144) TaxID=431595 RepID=K3WPN9_GLOUD